MRNHFKQYGRITLSTTGNVAKVGRRYPAAPALTHSTSPRHEIGAQALRTFAANGFGDAPIGRTAPHSLLDSIELYHQARTYRSYQLREIVRAMLQAVGDLVRRRVDRFKRQQHARATYLALSKLDARTLRDLGFHRSELMSVTAELVGAADATRTRLVPAPA